MPRLYLFEPIANVLRNVNARSEVPISLMIGMGGRLIVDLMLAVTSFVHEDINRNTLTRDTALNLAPLCLMAITALAEYCASRGAVDDDPHERAVRNRLLRLGVLYVTIVSTLNATNTYLDYRDYSASNVTNDDKFNEREAGIHLGEAIFELLYFCCECFPLLWAACCGLREEHRHVPLAEQSRSTEAEPLLEGGYTSGRADTNESLERVIIEDSNGSEYQPLIDSNHSNNHGESYGAFMPRPRQKRTENKNDRKSENELDEKRAHRFCSIL